MKELNLHNQLMDQKSAAAYLGTTVGTLNSWRCTGKNTIPYVRWGNRIRYRKEDLDAWIQNNLVNQTDSLAQQLNSNFKGV